MERRVLLAITLSFIVLFLFQRFVMPPPQPRPTASNATVGTSPEQVPASAPPGGAMAGQAPASPSAAAGGAMAGQAPATPGNAGQAPATGTATQIVGDAAERRIAVDGAKFNATLSTRGGRLLHWVLKEFKNNNGEPLDLVPSAAGEAVVRPLSLSVDDPAISARLNDAIYRVAATGDTIALGASPSTIVLDAEWSDGLKVTKTIEFHSNYQVTVDARIDLNGQRLNPTIHWGPGLGDELAHTPPSSFFSPSYTAPAQPIVHVDGDVERIPPATAGAREGAYRYAGVEDHYFVSLLVNDVAGRAFRIEYAPLAVPSPADPASVGHYVSYGVRFQTPPDQARFFFGPKAFDDLRAIDPEFTRVIHFGMFSWLAAPLLGALKRVHGFVGNWGWSIVVLTILINLAMFPLRHKSVVSMRKMQEIQPQMKAIQDRYAKYKITDPERQKMNTEVMELYKAKGVNPASGCVPMLLTFPFLFAFYAMLSVAIEIRGATFFGWITNLSAPDPYFITPILMGAAQFWQTKMTPTSGDPTQQKIMLFMPLMFTAMSLSFPSGLVVYWLVSTVFTIAQQQFTNYLIGSPAKAAAK
jgi:YidC/Oxa1 family membrane protein insertase